MKGRSRLDTLCEMLWLIRKKSFTPYEMERKLGINSDRCHNFLNLLMRRGLIECRIKTTRYRRKKSFDSFKPYLERGHYTRYVYRATLKGVELGKKYRTIKDVLI